MFVCIFEERLFAGLSLGLCILDLALNLTQHAVSVEIYCLSDFSLKKWSMFAALISRSKLTASVNRETLAGFKNDILTALSFEPVKGKKNLQQRQTNYSNECAT